MAYKYKKKKKKRKTKKKKKANYTKKARIETCKETIRPKCVKAQNGNHKNGYK
jgi:hypothetical protein